MNQSKSTVTTKTPTQDSRGEITSRVSPFLIRLAYPLFRYLVLPGFFSDIRVQGQAHLPSQGAVVLAPTHRSRWDAILVAYAAGHHITGRDPRFMVSIDEVRGLQGWFIRRLGGFPVNTHKSDISSLRHGIDLLKQKHMLVIFPEGHIAAAEQEVQSIQGGLAYLSLQAEINHPGLDAHIVPMSIHYDPPVPSWRSRAEIKIGPPISVADYCQQPKKDCVQQLRSDLRETLHHLHQQNALATTAQEEA
jgi:1-acyl-sn-glycerol-3-phosphate acyltransferase